MKLHKFFIVLYVFSLALGSSAAAQDSSRLVYGDIARGRLSREQPEERWVFAGHTGDRIIAVLLADQPDALDTYLTLQDDADLTLSTDDDSGPGLSALIGPFQIPADGDYTLIAERYSGGGNYSLYLLNIGTLPHLTLGKSLVGVVNENHPVDYFVVDTPELSLLRLEAADNERYSDPNLSLFTQDGYLLGTERLDSAVIDPIAPLEDNLYVVEVSWNRDGVGGAYELSLTPSAVELLENNIRQRGTIDDSEQIQRYYFEGVQDELLLIDLAATAGLIPSLTIATLDTSETLFSNTGTAVEGVSSWIRLPATGIYVIEVRSLNETTGTFEVLLMRYYID